MKAHGNGTPSVCANNLLRIIRGEVPFDRIKGLDPRLIDKPFQSGLNYIESDARTIVEAYEPRVRLDGLTVTGNGTEAGDIAIKANIVEKEG